MSRTHCQLLQGLGLLSCGAAGDFSAVSSRSLSRCFMFLSSRMTPGETAQRRCGTRPGGPGSGCSRLIEWVLGWGTLIRVLLMIAGYQMV